MMQKEERRLRTTSVRDQRPKSLSSTRRWKNYKLINGCHAYLTYLLLGNNFPLHNRKLFLLFSSFCKERVLSSRPYRRKRYLRRTGSMAVTSATWLLKWGYLWLLHLGVHSSLISKSTLLVLKMQTSALKNRVIPCGGKKSEELMVAWDKGGE